MYPRKSPIQQGRRRVVSGAVPYPAKCCTSRGEPGSRYAPAGWPAWHRPPRNPTGSRFSNRRAAAEQASGGVSGSESLSDTSPWLSGRACHPSQKENSTLALGRVRAWHCGSCPCNRGYDWKRPGAATGVIRIVGAGGFNGTVLLPGTGGFPHRNLYQRGRGVLLPVSQRLETCRPGGYG